MIPVYATRFEGGKTFYISMSDGNRYMKFERVDGKQFWYLCEDHKYCRVDSSFQELTTPQYQQMKEAR